MQSTNGRKVVALERGESGTPVGETTEETNELETDSDIDEREDIGSLTPRVMGGAEQLSLFAFLFSFAAAMHHRLSNIAVAANPFDTPCGFTSSILLRSYRNTSTLGLARILTNTF